MLIHALKNRAYPKSNIEHLVVVLNDNGLELILQGEKKNTVKLDLDGEVKLLELILPHLKERLK